MTDITIWTLNLRLYDVIINFLNFSSVLRSKCFDWVVRLVFLVQVKNLPKQNKARNHAPDHQDEEGALHVGDGDHAGHGDSTTLNWVALIGLRPEHLGGDIGLIWLIIK